MKKGKRSLSECIKAYRNVERLHDYKCAKCNNVGTASRELKIEKLPPVSFFKKFFNSSKILSVHFLMFVYDKDTMMKKKLFDDISFPKNFGSERIRFYLEVATDILVLTDVHESEYELMSVICHTGENAFGTVHGLV